MPSEMFGCFSRLYVKSREADIETGPEGGGAGAADSIFGRVSKVALGYPKASRAPPPLRRLVNNLPS